MSKKLQLPDPQEVARQLKSINAYSLEGEGGKSLEDVYGGGIEVRLQVMPSGSWSVHYGDPGYDTDHRGYWASSSVPGSNENFDALDLAQELIHEAGDDAAQDGFEVVERDPKTTVATRSR